MQAIVKKIIDADVFREQPPVVVDIGCGGSEFGWWDTIKSKMIWVGFDADSRELGVQEDYTRRYFQRVVVNKVVHWEERSSAEFFLTEAPTCSSLLEPDSDGLKPWIFKSKFNVTERLEIPSVTLEAALKSEHIEPPDILKIDSQGSDLRLLESLSNWQSCLVLELEPGILDAYIDEDKAWSVLASVMGSKKFFLDDMRVRSVHRLSESSLKELSWLDRLKVISNNGKNPGWVELRFFREPASIDSEREMLLLTLIAVLCGRPGFAMEVTDQGFERFGSPIFQELKTDIISSMSWSSGFKNVLFKKIQTLFHPC